MTNLFKEKNAIPMLVSDGKPFDDPNFIFELKFDGIRCLAYIGGDQVVLKSRNLKDITKIFPEFAELFKNVKKPCVLDGEIVCMKDSKPDFYLLQRRNLSGVGNETYGSIKYKASYVVFDILQIDDDNVCGLPLEERKKLLSKNLLQNDDVVVINFIETHGMKYFELVKAKGLEGVIAKKKDSKYFCGEKTANWIKFKVRFEEDFIVLGYTKSDSNRPKDIILGYYDKNNILKIRGKVYLAVTKSKQDVVEKFAELNKINKVSEQYNKFASDAVWLKPELVCTVGYSELTASGAMRNPVFKNFRYDKSPQDCKENIT